jgi:hypothetical protein
MMFYNAASFNQNLSKWNMNFVENSRDMLLFSGIVGEEKKPSKARLAQTHFGLGQALLRSYV